MADKTLIIGGVAGGATAAARLRRRNESMQIIMFERGEFISYANCGLPYYIGGVIRNRDALLLQTPQAMLKKFNVDVRTSNEVTAIRPAEKKVTVRNLKTGAVYDESYDNLIIATGSSPVKPPIPGIESPGIFTLWTVPDTDRIRNFIEEKKPARAAVVGGGFIGLEMAENLKSAGLSVSLIEMQEQVMAPLDREMAEILHVHLERNGVELILGDGVKRFRPEAGGTVVELASGRTVVADMVVLAIGVRPNSQLAKDAGLALNAKGGIVVDEYLRTSEKDIYAVGDVIEVTDYVSGGKTMIPLAGPANKQARILADNLSGDRKTYGGTIGTAIAKVFELNAASAGLNEKQLAAAGKKKDADYHTVLINQKSHAGYYPGATTLTLKLLFEKSGTILGAQVVGSDGVDKRIDTIATVMRLRGTVHDLAELELAYAPPFSSAKDPVNMLGFVAENVLDTLVTCIEWRDAEALLRDGSDDFTVLDVTEDSERTVFAVPGSYHIPLGQLRERLSELDPSKLIVPYCAVGVRSYNAARILMQNGFKRVAMISGGTSFYKATHRESDALSETAAYSANVGALSETAAYSANVGAASDTEYSADRSIKILDCSGLQCPGPIMKVYEALCDMEDSQILQVSATDMGFTADAAAWCRRTGNTFVRSEQRGGEYVVYIRKGGDCCDPHDRGTPRKQESAPSQGAAQSPETALSPAQGKTIIVFSGDLDRVLASFIIANGAAAMGRPVTMFFTFWGLNVLRKTRTGKIKKPFMDKMFASMMPKGSAKLKLSKLNMAGMGTAMMKKVMNDKNVDSLETLIRHALDNGVKLIACTMSMDIMGITKEELIDGVEFAGVASYLGDAEESNVNLFI